MSFYLGAAELSFRRKTVLWTSEQKVKIDRIAYKDFYNQPGAAHGRAAFLRRRRSTLIID